MSALAHAPRVTPTWGALLPHAVQATPTWATVLPAALLTLFILLSYGIAHIAGSDPPDRDDDDAGGPGPGGGGSRPHGPDDRYPPTGDPAWWAQFEREFGAYVAERDAHDTRRAVAR